MYLKDFKGKKIPFSGMFELKIWEGSPDLVLSKLSFWVRVMFFFYIAVFDTEISTLGLSAIENDISVCSCPGFICDRIGFLHSVSYDVIS